MNSTPLKSISDLDSEDLCNQAKSITDSIEKTWKEDKKYTYKLNKLNSDINVQTYHNDRLNDDYWSARVSALKEVSFNDRKEYFSKLEEYIVGSMNCLEKTHTEYEKQYIHELVDYELKPITLKPNKDFDTFTYLARLEYKFPFPLKRRVFFELIHICKSRTESLSYVISLAIDPKFFQSESSRMVNARYTSVEKIFYGNSTDDLEWKMATCSTPGGSIPGWLSKLSINSAIAKDVPSFLNWSDSI
ncbi:DEHA2E12540p [Debaryomyces hansenii CBS767]|jgi:hypothetical protein|uniref:DEHA2E12540p n=1 Tax=Debaryomyces hansenii (strain ATCC 36239 / CBS 767 / BCRC 21394 / JCM 1990 / NBRC 0083 / IGC 2968) TaxID=284592 RepID=Q6BPL9_DEBHA|nr:DEHA2E12540p [Debaryomyces hansenii CBS767]CAG88092.1 DEHA2E12540p [Debaryomyces hansenii CBS767]|eukprot:XP_459851.1 DEHA2E12540p [Debaryomyces hansenii CBS767]